MKSFLDEELNCKRFYDFRKVLGNISEQLF